MCCFFVLHKLCLYERKAYSPIPDFSLCTAWQCNKTASCTAGLVLFMTSDRYLLSDLWESPYSLGWTNCFGALSTVLDLHPRKMSVLVTLSLDHCNRQIDKQTNGPGELVVLKLMLKIKPARFANIFTVCL